MSSPSGTRFLLALLLFSTLSNCKQGTKQAGDATISADTTANAQMPAAWSLQSNIYEVNLRQYAANSSFANFQQELPRLRDMGVEILWFMPITPISKVDRKGILGSYYAVQNYREVNPEYGNMNDWKALVNKAHELGFKVITDWVPNHSGADHPWLQSHPEFYAKDSTGKVIAPFDWTDVRKLDYSNKTLRDSMIASMKFWITETGVDGFRCDVAGEVPTDFWKQCIDSLRKVKDVFMLAESDKPELYEAGFNASYPWSIQTVLYGMYSGKTTHAQLHRALDSMEQLLPKNAMRMYFTVNHDENSWNGTEFERFGDGHKAFAVWTQTMHRSIPLIYSGQEEPNKKRLKFFEKDPINWGKYELAPFYKTLLQLRKNTPALAADASYKGLNSSKPDEICAYMREKNGSKVVVILNLSKTQQQFTIEDDALKGNAQSVFGGSNETLDRKKTFNMKPWEYIVYKY